MAAARRGKATLGPTLLACFCLSLGIELLQPLLSGFRASDITDLITNLLGGALGYGLYAVCRPAARWFFRRKKREA